MTFYCNGEPLGRGDDVELEGVDISGLKVWKDETFTAEVDTSGWSKEHWQAIFGFIPIIRCKDCKHRPTKPAQYKNGFDLDFPDDKCPCKCEDDYYSWYPGDNWYCASAERKDND